MDFKKSPPTHFEDVDDLDEEVAHKEIEALRESINYHDYLYYVENRQVLKRLQKAGVRVWKMASEKKGRPLSGKTFVFSGRLDNFTRAEAENLVERLGGALPRA